MSLSNDPTATIRDLTAGIERDLIAIRRDIHAHPELAFEEVRTAGIVARELDRLGIPYRAGVAKTGIIGMIEGGRPGPVLAIRGDMDGLPIQEQTGLPWASTVEGRMHACGHDLHTTTVIGVAEVLKRLAPRLAGSVKLVFQPAEEQIAGMKIMLDEGLLENPKVDRALSLHNDPGVPVGRLTYTPGPAMAAGDAFEVTVHGVSGHGAHPHNAVDPVVAAAYLITQLQTVITREIDPRHTAVLTVGAIHGGDAANIIPDTVMFRGTVRTVDPADRDTAEAAIRRFCAAATASYRVRADIAYRRGVPAAVNDPTVAEETAAAVRRQLGDVIDTVPAVLGSEDLAFLLERVPGVMLWVGSGAPGRSDKIHNSGYAPDEGSIAVGVQALARAAVEYLS
jgi:amidohydrolase